MAGRVRGDLSAFLSDELIDAAIEHGRPLELPPRKFRYAAFVDPSGGRHDAFTICIGHKEADAGSSATWCAARARHSTPWL